MDQFQRMVLERLPLAEAMLSVLGYVWEEQCLGDLFEEFRGTGSEVAVTFPLLVELVMIAITEYQGSGRQSFNQARREGRLAATNDAVYGKLRRLPIKLSEAFLRETTRRVQQLLPVPEEDNSLPSALRRFHVLVVDGKKLKQLPKRLKPLREVSGKVLGGKVVVGMMLNQDLVMAMHASPDGEANDAPLTPGLIDQMESSLDQPLLIVADRQFCDLKIPHRIISGGSALMIRYSKKLQFHPEKAVQFRDAQGRAVHEAWGMLGRERDSRRMYLRQITLERPGEEDVILITNLLHREAIPAEQILDAYLQRWSIERVFQQVTEVFHLQSFIGTSPQGAIFQFALCSCLYNVIQVLRQYLAHAQHLALQSLSSELIFRDVCKQLTTATQFLTRAELTASIHHEATNQQTRERLATLLEKQPVDAWLKTPPKKPMKPQPKKLVRGGHSSAHKLIQKARQKRAKLAEAKPGC
jgi:hypothetical protein